VKYQDIIHYALNKRGAYETYPFGPVPICVKVCNRIFLQGYWTDKKKMMTVKCDMMTGDFYRNLFPEAVVRGYHCPPVQQPYWNTVYLEKDVPDHEIYNMIDHAYEVVVNKLSLKKRIELERQ